MKKQNVEEKVKKKAAPFIAPGSLEKVTEQELNRRQQFAKKAKEVGIDIYSVDDEHEHENPYRAEALYLLTVGKEVPQRLKEQIKKYDKEYNEKNKK